MAAWISPPLRRMYNALTNDQLLQRRACGRNGTARQPRSGKTSLWQQGELGTQIVSAFGRDQQGSIARLRAAIASGAKGRRCKPEPHAGFNPGGLAPRGCGLAIREIASGTWVVCAALASRSSRTCIPSLRRNPEVYRRWSMRLAPKPIG